MQNGSEFAIPATVMGELYFGAEKSVNRKENTAKLRLFESSITILESNAETAKHYGKIKHDLLLKGKPIPENDIWIAAVTMQTSAILVTRDTHFSHVSGLSIEAW